MFGFTDEGHLHRIKMIFRGHARPHSHIAVFHDKQKYNVHFWKYRIFKFYK